MIQFFIHQVHPIKIFPVLKDALKDEIVNTTTGLFIEEKINETRKTCNNYSNAIFLNMEKQCLDIFDLEIEKNILSIPIEQKYTAIRFMEELKQEGK